MNNRQNLVAAYADPLVLVGLLLLCAVPVAAGAMRVTELAGTPIITPDNARFVADPAPAVVHIVSASLFCVLGAFQVARGPRRKSIRWHRVAGRVVAPLGVVAGLSGIWLSFAYDAITREGAPLFTMRLAAGAAMVACILVGVVRVFRHDLTGHGAWMMRGYALGVAAGTQAFTHLPWLFSGEVPGQLETTLAMAAGWLINIAVVELHLRRQARQAAPAGPDAAHASAMRGAAFRNSTAS